MVYVQAFVPARARSVRDMLLTLSCQRYANTKRVIVLMRTKLLRAQTTSLPVAPVALTFNWVAYFLNTLVSVSSEIHARIRSL